MAITNTTPQPTANTNPSSIPQPVANTNPSSIPRPTEASDTAMGGWTSWGIDTSQTYTPPASVPAPVRTAVFVETADSEKQEKSDANHAEFHITEDIFLKEGDLMNRSGGLNSTATFSVNDENGEKHHFILNTDESGAFTITDYPDNNKFTLDNLPNRLQINQFYNDGNKQIYVNDSAYDIVLDTERGDYDLVPADAMSYVAIQNEAIASYLYEEFNDKAITSGQYERLLNANFPSDLRSEIFNGFTSARDGKMKEVMDKYVKDQGWRLNYDHEDVMYAEHSMRQWGKLKRPTGARIFNHNAESPKDRQHREWYEAYGGDAEAFLKDGNQKPDAYDWGLLKGVLVTGFRIFTDPVGTVIDIAEGDIWEENMKYSWADFAVDLISIPIGMGIGKVAGTALKYAGKAGANRMAKRASGRLLLRKGRSISRKLDDLATATDSFYKKGTNKLFKLKNQGYASLNPTTNARAVLQAVIEKKIGGSELENAVNAVLKTAQGKKLAFLQGKLKQGAGAFYKHARKKLKERISRGLLGSAGKWATDPEGAFEDMFKEFLDDLMEGERGEENPTLIPNIDVDDASLFGESVEDEDEEEEEDEDEEDEDEDEVFDYNEPDYHKADEYYDDEDEARYHGEVCPRGYTYSPFLKKCVPLPRYDDKYLVFS